MISARFGAYAPHRAAPPPAPEAPDWRHAESQRLRFEVIAQAADFNGCSVLDLGCGTGDLNVCLDECFTDLRYLGIDQMPEFIEAARVRFVAQPDTAYARALRHCAAAASRHRGGRGALGYRCADPHWVFNMVARRFLAAAQVLVFNLLDAAVFPEHPLLVGHDIDDVAAFCRKLAPRVEVVRGYTPDDATIVMRR